MTLHFAYSVKTSWPDYIYNKRHFIPMNQAMGVYSLAETRHLGGIGKAQLAVAYMKRYRNEYSPIFWLNIKDEAAIQQSFTKVVRQILRQHPDANRLSALDLQQNNKEVVEAVTAWLSITKTGIKMEHSSLPISSAPGPYQILPHPISYPGG